jgi:hypothetical protein
LFGRSSAPCASSFVFEAAEHGLITRGNHEVTDQAMIDADSGAGDRPLKSPFLRLLGLQMSVEKVFMSPDPRSTA